MVASFFQKGREFVNAQQTSIMSAATVISALTVVSAILGIVRSRFLVSYLERSQADAFLVGFRIPDFLFQLLVAGVLSATFIPVFTRVNTKSSDEGRTLVNTLVTQLSLIYVLFALVVGWFAPQILRLMTGPGFSDAQVLLSA